MVVIDTVFQCIRVFSEKISCYLQIDFKRPVEDFVKLRQICIFKAVTLITSQLLAVETNKFRFIWEEWR